MAGAQNLSWCLHRRGALRDSQHWIIMATLHIQPGGGGGGGGEGGEVLPRIGSLSAVPGACFQGCLQLQ